MRFQPVVATSEEDALRSEVREFLAQELPPGMFLPALGFNAHHSPAFSRKLAERGWVGMAIPSRYGGHDRGPVDRFIVSEELLAAGAPVAAHWVADRQTAPALLAFGTEFQKRHFLPRIARGECYFSIGMSEPDAGSDLASVRTTGTKVEGGWSITGTKVWTSWAHRNHFFMALCRTSPLDGDRHAGLSQFIIDLSAPGVTVNAILSLDGSQHFNEVVLDDVFVPDDMVLGEIGMGWQQVTSELAHERSGPERFLSPWPLLESYVEGAVAGTDATGGLLGGASREDGSSLSTEKIGGLVARYWVLHHLSFSVARALQRGSAPAVEAAIVKDLGTSFEQEVVATLQGLVDDDPDPTSSSRFESLLAEATLVAPSFTIRGGTTEILRSVIARDLGPRAMAASAQTDTVLDDTLDRLFGNACSSEARHTAEAEGWIPHLWDALAAADMPWLGVPRSAGGPGGELSDAFCLLRLAGRHAVPLPLAESSGLLGGWIVARAGLQLPDGPLSVALPRPGDQLHFADGRLSGCLHRVPWGSRVSTVALATSDEGPRVVLLHPSRATCVPGRNVAGEPRDKLTFFDVPVGPEQVAFASSDILEEIFLRGALSRALLMAGAMEAIAELTVSYSAQRHQFGRPIGRFQAVAQRLARLASETEAAALAASVAAQRFEVAGIEAAFEVAAAKTTVARAATQVAVDAHQIHGAIGMSQEYPLHHFTRRLWAWRQEWGSEARWAAVLGRQTMTDGAPELWPRLTIGLRDGAEPEFHDAESTALIEAR